MRLGNCSYTRASLSIVTIGAAMLMLLSTSTEAANGSVNYTYDALGRVVTASYDTGACITYKYDANGNRTAQTILVTTSTATGVWGCFNWGGAKWGP